MPIVQTTDNTGDAGDVRPASLVPRLSVSCFAALACADALKYGRRHPGSRRLALALDDDHPADGYARILELKLPVQSPPDAAPPMPAVKDENDARARP